MCLTKYFLFPESAMTSVLTTLFRSNLAARCGHSIRGKRSSYYEQDYNAALLTFLSLMFYVNVQNVTEKLY
jgi:hypothetical protein